MKTYDNNGNLGAEINTSFVDGKLVITNTSYSNYGGQQRVISQHITVQDRNTGEGYVKTVLGGKLLP
jgi:hypothetical protein